MIRIRLPAAEAERLDQAFRQETDPKYKDRLQIIRLASRDRPHQDIAADLATTPRSVQRWLNAYLERGLDGLRPRKAKGRQPRKTLPARKLAPDTHTFSPTGNPEPGVMVAALGT